MQTNLYKKVRMAEPRFDQSVIEDISQILASGKLRSGSVTQRFEEFFAQKMDALYGCAVSSGTAALHLALETCVEKDTEVLVPAFSFFATASSVVHAGCTPVFVDVNPETYLMDLVDAEEKMTQDTSAILPVNLFGNVVNPEEVERLANEYDLMIIYDCAQSIGSKFRGWEVGRFADMSCFSFYPSKMITTGEGGMVTSNNENLINLAKKLRSHGETERYIHEEIGFNYRSTEIASALGLNQLGKLDRYVERRRSIALFYDLAIGNIDGLTPQLIPEPVHSSYNYYTITVEDTYGCSRDELKEQLEVEDIETSVYYPLPLDTQPAFFPYREEGCKVAKDLSGKVLSIPIHQSMTHKEAERVVKALRKFTGY